MVKIHHEVEEEDDESMVQNWLEPQGTGVVKDGEEVRDLEKMILGEWFDYLQQKNAMADGLRVADRQLTDLSTSW